MDRDGTMSKGISFYFYNPGLIIRVFGYDDVLATNLIIGIWGYRELPLVK